MDDYHIPALPEFELGELLQLEKEVSGLYLSGHPLDAYRERIKTIGGCRLADLSGEEMCIRDRTQPVFTIARLGGLSVFRRMDALHVGVWLLLFLILSLIHI